MLKKISLKPSFSKCTFWWFNTYILIKQMLIPLCTTPRYEKSQITKTRCFCFGISHSSWSFYVKNFIILLLASFSFASTRDDYSIIWMLKIHIFKRYLSYYYSFLRIYLLMGIYSKRYISGHKSDYIVSLSIGNLEVKLPEHQRKMGIAILKYVDLNGVW